MTPDTTECQVTRAEFLRAVAGFSGLAVGGRWGVGRATAGTDDETSEAETVVDFDWSYPRCPDTAVGELDRYFFGDLDSSGGFHLDDGDGAAERPDGCVLRTDADDVLATSLPDGHRAQPDRLDRYPRRGDVVAFDHYVHREGATTEFRFGVQPEIDSHYAVRFETDSDADVAPSLHLLRSDAGDPTPLDEVTDLSYETRRFHEFEIEWRDDDIAVTLDRGGERTSIAAADGTYDQGGIAFYREGTGVIRSYAHLWNAVEVR